MIPEAYASLSTPDTSACPAPPSAKLGVHVRTVPEGNGDRTGLRTVFTAPNRYVVHRDGQVAKLNLQGESADALGLNDVRRDEPVVVVEGESDYFIARALGWNVVAVPGANVWPRAVSEATSACPSVFVIDEGDAGGARLWREATTAVGGRAVRFGLGGADVRDLWLASGREVFAFSEAVDALIGELEAETRDRSSKPWFPLGGPTEMGGGALGQGSASGARYLHPAVGRGTKPTAYLYPASLQQIWPWAEVYDEGGNPPGPHFLTSLASVTKRGHPPPECDERWSCPVCRPARVRRMARTLEEDLVGMATANWSRSLADRLYRDRVPYLQIPLLPDPFDVLAGDTPDPRLVLMAAPHPRLPDVGFDPGRVERAMLDHAKHMTDQGDGWRGTRRVTAGVGWPKLSRCWRLREPGRTSGKGRGKRTATRATARKRLEGTWRKVVGGALPKSSPRSVTLRCPLPGHKHKDRDPSLTVTYTEQPSKNGDGRAEPMILVECAVHDFKELARHFGIEPKHFYGVRPYESYEGGNR